MIAVLVILVDCYKYRDVFHNANNNDSDKDNNNDLKIIMIPVLS